MPRCFAVRWNSGVKEAKVAAFPAGAAFQAGVSQGEEYPAEADLEAAGKDRCINQRRGFGNFCRVCQRFYLAEA